MKVLTSWIVRCVDLVVYPNRFPVVASTMVMEEVTFWQKALWKKLKSRWKRVTKSSCYVETLG